VSAQGGLPTPWASTLIPGGQGTRRLNDRELNHPGKAERHCQGARRRRGAGRGGRAWGTRWSSSISSQSWES
jgi:hypothetical protein